MNPKDEMVRELLSLEGRSPLDQIFSLMSRDLKEEVRPLLARLPLIHLMKKLVDLASHASEQPVRQALLDLACLAIDKHEYTRGLYRQLTEAVMTSDLRSAGETLSALAPSTSPQHDAPLAMEMLSVMTELLSLGGEDAKAIYCFEIAGLIADRFDLELNRAIVNQQLGHFLTRRGRFDEAESALSDATQRFERTMPSLVRTTNLLRIVVYTMRLYGTPEISLPQDLETFISCDVEAKQVVLLARAQQALNRDDFETAEVLCHQIRADQPDQEKLPAKLLRLESTIARRKGQFERADLLLRQAGEKNEEGQKPGSEILWESFFQARDLGLYDKAEKLLDHLQQVDHSVKPDYQRALITYYKGDREAAEKLWLSCLERATDDRIRADCYGMLGIILKDFQEAEQALHQAIELYIKLDRKLDHAVSLSHLAIAEIYQGVALKARGLPLIAISNFPRAEKLLNDAQEIAEQLGADSFLIDLKINYARLAWVRELYDDALKYYKEIIAHLENVYLALTKSHHIDAYQGAHEDLYEMALRCAIEAGKTEEALLFSEHGKARRFLRDVAQRAENTVQSVSHPLLDEERGLISSIRPLRDKLGQSRPLSSREQQVLTRAEERLVELRQEMQHVPELSAELSSRVYQPLSAEMLRRIVFGVESDQDQAPADAEPNQTALVGFFLDEDETLIFWLDSDSPQPAIERASIGRQEIAAAAEQLRDLFSPHRIHYRRPERTTDLAWLRPIGQRLLQPLRERLAKRSALIVAPHAGLHLLPLHLLADEGGVPLGVTHSISYVANLSFYSLLLGRDHARQARPQLPSLCLSTAAREDDRLIHDSFAIAAKAFAERSGGIFRQGVDASYQLLKEQAGTADSLYLSCHGLFNGEDPLESSLFLSNGFDLPSKFARRPAASKRAWQLIGRSEREETEDFSLGLSVRDILNLRINSRLVVLDACLSGVQRFSAGDEPLGFPTAFLLAGASALIASNWVVEQNCGRDLMIALLDHWTTGEASLGEAMRQAYAETRAKYPHPFHWAAFSLFGNDRLRFKQTPELG